MLYLAKKDIPYLQLGVTLLCIRLKDTDKDDWNNMTRVTRYIQSTMGTPLILGIDDTNMIWWYVDAIFGVHCGTKSHAVIMVTMGQGASRSNSTKHKFNTKSSTEAELFDIDDKIPLIVCYGYFL